MRGGYAGALIGALLMPAVAQAGNSDEVNAGLDVTLTGGAVVANVYTGASLWYNPAGLARSDKPSLELTGVTMQIQVLKNPGLITIDSMPQSLSEGSGVNFSIIPQALVFTVKLKSDKMKLGIGLFNASSRRAFLTEQASSPAGESPQIQAFAGRNSRLDFFHISSGLAGRLGSHRKQKVQLGGAFDLVVSNSRVDESYTLFYDDGVAGQISSGQVQSQTGFGFQLKGGIQWMPIPVLRVGMSVTSPTFVFAALERTATQYNQSPGSTDPVPAGGEQSAQGSEGRGGRGVWWGVEPGNLRFGLAYVAKWGWIEGDIVYYFRLREDELDLDLRGFANGRIGSAFRVTKNIQLGLGLFTDFSQVDEIANAPLATAKIDFFGVHLGFLYSNLEVDPDREEPSKTDGLGFSLAIGIRYAHGRGDTIGLSLPPQYDPANVEQIAVATKVNEIAINLAVKVAF
jgi:hypothetical protein